MSIFRMIPFQYFDAFTNMALDEAIMERVRTGESLPVIRFYGWQPSAVSIGFFQGIRDEANLAEARAAGVNVVRRQTGGGAVYHDQFGEVTYSIIGREDLFPRNILKSYQFICDDILFALQTLGVNARFVPINDILVGEQKISGSAQTRRNGVLLQHGTVLYNVDVERMFAILNVSQEKISDKLVKSVKKRVTCMSDLTKSSMSDLIHALEIGFSRNRIIESASYSQGELERAQQLVKEKYLTETWNFRL